MKLLSRWSYFAEVSQCFRHCSFTTLLTSGSVQHQHRKRCQPPWAHQLRTSWWSCHIVEKFKHLETPLQNFLTTSVIPLVILCCRIYSNYMDYIHTMRWFDHSWLSNASHCSLLVTHIKLLKFFLFDWLCYVSNFNVMNYSKSTLDHIFLVSNLSPFPRDYIPLILEKKKKN